MKFLPLLLSSTAFSASAFTLQPFEKAFSRQNVQVAASNDAESDSWQNQVGKFVATGLVTASLWAAPAMVQNTFVGMDAPQILTSSVANAKQMASASGSRVNKDPESLLRYGLPINSKEVGSKVAHFCVIGSLFHIAAFVSHNIPIDLFLRPESSKLKLKLSNKTSDPNERLLLWITSRP